MINKRFVASILVVVLPMLLVLGLRQADLLEVVEARLEAMRYRLFNPRNQFSKEIVVLDIDDNTLATYANQRSVFGMWPWPRDVYYPIFQHLSQMGVRNILMDIMFIEASADEYNQQGQLINRDNDMAAANQDFPNISHAIFARKLPDEDAIRFTMAAEVYQLVHRHAVPMRARAGVLTNETNYNALDVPTELILANSPSLHCVSVHPDRIGVLRRQPATCQYQNDFYPSLAVLGAALPAGIAELQLQPDQLLIKTKDQRQIQYPLIDGQLPMHFYSYADTLAISRIPAANLIEDIRRLNSTDPADAISDFADLIVKPSQLADKIVIFGASAKGAYDRLMTPYGELPGVLMQATLLSNLMNGDRPYYWPAYSGLLVTLLMLILIAGLLAFSKRIVVTILVPVAALVAFMVFAILAFQSNMIVPMAELVLSFPLAFIASLAYQIFVEGAEKRKYRRVLGNMVDPQIVSEALKDLEALKRGGQKEITAFFSDVAGFSTISEQLSASDLAALLNEYLSAMTLVLKEYRGTLDKYIGDAVVGIFGAPLELPHHPLAAAQAALKMMKALEELRDYWQMEDLYIPAAHQMQIRIGLNSGPAKVGFMGTNELASYTMMGDTVNLAARLEAAAKDYGVSILISESTYSLVKNELHTRLLDMVVVMGKTMPVKIYELIGYQSEIRAAIAEATAVYEQGFEFYLQRKWSDAIACFERVAQLKGQPDVAARLLVERCEAYQQSEPPEDWQGNFVRTHK